MTRRRGFTLVELLVVIGIIALLIGMLLPALQTAKRNARSLEDATHIREIHQGMLVFAGDENGILPTPGLINRKADPFTGQQRPGAGPEDYSKNTSANLYSAMIIKRYFDPGILVSPAEANPDIVSAERQCDVQPPNDYCYDYNAYRPEDDIYWDGDSKTGDPPVTDRFQADIESGRSYTSYFHLALCGRRKARLWRNDADKNVPLMSSRAPYRGADAGTDDYDRSYTLQMHGSKREWMGNAVCADNHTERINTFYPPELAYELSGGGPAHRDNIFDWEYNDPSPGEAGDVFLTMTRSAEVDTIEDYRERLAP